MSENLKPCPFCGELPDVYFRIKQGISHNAGYICVICRKCDYCFASSDVEAGTPFYRLLAAYEEITEKWDKRCGDEVFKKVPENVFEEYGDKQAKNEKREGHWFDVGSLSCRCSECGCKNNKESNYCPECGAYMKGESNE